METQPVSFFFYRMRRERREKTSACDDDVTAAVSGGGHLGLTVTWPRAWWIWVRRGCGGRWVWQEGQHAATGSACFSALTSSPPSQIFTSHFFPEQTDGGGLAPPPPAPPLPAHPYSIAGILFNPTSRIWLLWWKQRLDAGQLRLLFTHFTLSFSFFAFSFGANLRFLPKRINGLKENNTGRRFFF